MDLTDGVDSQRPAQVAGPPSIMAESPMSEPNLKPTPGTEPDVDAKQLIKIAIDLAPLLIFFGFYATLGIFWATGALMVTSVASMIISRTLLGHISTTLVVTTALVVGFGALTFWFNDPRFIQIKPTIIYLLFATVLLGGLLLGRPLLQMLLGEAFKLPTHAWSTLSVRWAIFFLVMAALNEIVWRNFSEAAWASFKVFGFPVLTFAFIATQMGFIQRHRLPTPDTSDNSAQR